MTDAGVTPEHVERASRRIDGLVRRTPVISHGDLVLKLELLQHAGAFKPRCAANRVLAERDRAGHLPAAGLVTASGGNHRDRHTPSVVERCGRPVSHTRWCSRSSSPSIQG
jgi:threonine dehydratase